MRAQVCKIPRPSTWYELRLKYWDLYAKEILYCNRCINTFSNYVFFDTNTSHGIGVLRHQGLKGGRSMHASASRFQSSLFGLEIIDWQSTRLYSLLYKNLII
jgi:hypothetical protein